MIYLTPKGTPTTKDDPDAIPCFANFNGGFLDAALRADSLLAFETAAIAAGLCLADTEDSPRKRGHLQSAPGVSISYIGSVVTKQAELDALGVVLKAAEMDTRYHVNVRLSQRAMRTLAKDADGNDMGPRWAITVAEWMTKGHLVLMTNKDERAKKYQGVELIDADRIATPVNRWA